MGFRRMNVRWKRRIGGPRTRGRRVGAPLTRTRWTRRKRVQQNLTRSVQWFKSVQAITSDTNGNIGNSELTSNVYTNDDFTTFGTLFRQFKILKVLVKYYPSNVGGESMQVSVGQGPSPGFPMLQRGDCLTYCGSVAPPASGITDVITRSSARLVQPRRFHKRWIDRPRGYMEWGETNTTGGVTTADPWIDGIHMLGENFTPVQVPGQQNFFYVMTLWKVLFRSRQE